MTKPETEKLKWFVGCDAPRDGGRPFIGTTFGGHYFSLYPKDDLADALRRHDFMVALCAQLNRAQGGGATPDAAPDAVTDEMVERATLILFPHNRALSADGRGKLKDKVRAALEDAHARSAGGEGNG